MATSSIYQLKADLFKSLAHPARIRVLDLLRDGERTVSELIPDVGLEPSHLSQQLGVLRRARIVDTRRQGSSVVYSVRDPRVFQLLTTAKELLTATLADTSEMLGELASLDFTVAVPRHQRAYRRS